MTEDLTRRRLFGLAGASAAGAAGLSLSGCSRGRRGGSDAGHAGGRRRRRLRVPARPDAAADHRAAVRRLGTDSQYIFLNAPYSGPGHGGTIILDPHGDLVWFGPNT